jgi:hypothetical protein
VSVARFFLLSGISAINSENYSLNQKIRKKISRPAFSICYCLRSTATGFLDFRLCKPALFRDPMCPTFRVGPMSALPPKADIASRQLDVCFVPKADIRCMLALRDNQQNNATDYDGYRSY